MSTKMSKKTQMLCISAVMLALATILSLLKIIDLPFGCSITFSVLGLGGMFRRLIPNKTLSFTLGYATCATLRYLCHVVSGFILWASAENIAWFFGDGALTTDIPFKLVQIAYSVVYNGFYMIPEIIVGSVVGC